MANSITQTYSQAGASEANLFPGGYLLGGGAPVNIGSALTIGNQNNVNGSIFAFNLATGSVATLPSAIGSGISYTFYTSVAPTSNHSGVTTNGTDYMIGSIHTDDSATVTGYNSAATTNKSFRLNGTTTGGAAIGEKFVVTDIDANTWLVNGFSISSGTAATPFNSAAG